MVSVGVDKMKRVGCFFGVLVLCFWGAENGSAQDHPMVEKYLIEARLDEGEQALLEHLEVHPGDDDGRFSLGILQFMQSVEHLGQSLHRHGSQGTSLIPFLRLPVPPNEHPEPVTYEEFRDIFKTMIRDLDKASASLAKIQSEEINLPLRLFQFHLDWDRDGHADEAEGLSEVAGQYLGFRAARAAEMEAVVVHFDRADVHWLRGYCHLLRSMCEFVLAYDQEAVWDVAARQFVRGAVVRYEFLMEEEVERGSLFGSGIVDMIAGIHNMGMPLVDSSRMERAHGHLMETIKQSRMMWEFAMSEIDDQGEWIPNPNQQTVVSSVRVNQEMVDGWYEFLDEMESILKGEKLVPFWRGTNERRGVNLYRVFHEPREFDLILWYQGSGAVPYLEEGEVTRPETWSRFQRIFRGDLIGFATWFN